MVTVFVDESGDLGLKGSQYFVIALLIPQKTKRISNFMKEFCAENELEEIKAYELEFSEKERLFIRMIWNFGMVRYFKIKIFCIITYSHF